MEGDANALYPEPAAYAKKFTGKYAHRNIGGGIGHNLPQEAPKAFVANRQSPERQNCPILQSNQCDGPKGNYLQNSAPDAGLTKLECFI
jgi:hypothetical protein